MKKILLMLLVTNFAYGMFPHQEDPFDLLFNNFFQPYTHKDCTYHSTHKEVIAETEATSYDYSVCKRHSNIFTNIGGKSRIKWNDVLGVAASASEQEIKKAVRKMKLKTHPDKTKKDTKQLFEAVKNAEKEGLPKEEFFLVTKDEYRSPLFGDDYFKQYLYYFEETNREKIYSADINDLYGNKKSEMKEASDYYYNLYQKFERPFFLTQVGCMLSLYIAALKLASGRGGFQKSRKRISKQLDKTGFGRWFRKKAFLLGGGFWGALSAGSWYLRLQSNSIYRDFSKINSCVLSKKKFKTKIAAKFNRSWSVYDKDDFSRLEKFNEDNTSQLRNAKNFFGIASAGFAGLALCSSLFLYKFFQDVKKEDKKPKAAAA